MEKTQEDRIYITSVIIGVLFLIMGLGPAAYEIPFMWRAVRTAGVITNIERIRLGNRTVVTNVVNTRTGDKTSHDVFVAFAAGGERYQGKVKPGTGMKVGQPVIIFHDPADPRRFRDGGWMFGSLLSSVLGSAFFIMGFVPLIKRNRRRNLTRGTAAADDAPVQGTKVAETNSGPLVFVVVLVGIGLVCWALTSPEILILPLIFGGLLVGVGIWTFKP